MHNGNKLYELLINYKFVVLYGFGAWSSTFQQEHRLRVFENRVLRKIFRTQREEQAGDWRKLRNEEHHDLYSPYYSDHMKDFCVAGRIIIQ
jgi:hypothetical protein